MNTTLSNTSSDKPCIAVVTMGVKLGDETRGYTRFRFLSELLCQEGFDVDLITSSFQHWNKEHRDCSKACYHQLPYRVVFIEEPGYKKNLDLNRILSHRQAAKNLRKHFEDSAGRYALIYAEIPPNDVARVCAEFAHKSHIPFVADINDLWPEAMRMVVNIPIISDIAFYPFARDAKITYELLSAAVGTSDEYAARPEQDRTSPYLRETVYVGNNLSAFDKGAHKTRSEIEKPASEIWATYAGTLGASYDLSTLIEAAALVQKRQTRFSKQDQANDGDRILNEMHGQDAYPPIRVKILGDGPDYEKLTNLAKQLNSPVDFLGYQDYEHMAGYLCASDIVVNSLVTSAAQSIVTKIGDYLASANPILNTGSSPEFRSKVEREGFGINVEAEDAEQLADALEELARNASLRKTLGAQGRTIAEEQFDQPRAYQRIVALIRNLL